MARLRPAGPAWDRFAVLPRGAARIVLAAFAVLLVAAALTYPPKPVRMAVPAPSATIGFGRPIDARDHDLLLYRAIAARVAGGESYYTAALAEQRARNFPVRPAVAVRLPTLAYLTAGLGQGGLVALGALLALAALAAWWRRLGEEPGAREHRTIALLLLVVGAAMGAKPAYAMLHEVWAGMLMALAFGLHRPGRWHWAWLAAAAACAVRELALPFVLLLGALALARRDWKEAVAWGVLTALFAALFAWHLAQVDALLLDSDRPSSSWLALRGLAGWTTNLVTSSILYQLPGPIAAPLVLLPLIGWAGWRSSAGLTGFLLHLGYGVLFMLAGRANNFYWALMVTPTWFIGLAFAPLAFASLAKAARGG